MRPLLIFLLGLALVTATFADDDPNSPGHSRHGSAFDSGMRTKPWKMEGLGDTPFPITSKNPEVQEWFNQGNALLHSFWFEEAERSFRWCLKLDPDCAMAYWGLARCGFTWFVSGAAQGEYYARYHTFLKEAGKRKDKVTERERMYIEAWQEAFGPESKEPHKLLAKSLQKIVLKFPDDVEAKSQLAFYNIGDGSTYANELVIQQVLAKNPRHPGAHHASIHNWDDVDPLQALKSCEMYGISAPGVGHALHMPGHCYSKMGMWHEAARAMDAATRTELKYMNDRLALPFETWNYPHNRNYLCYIQEQLGMAEASIQGARDMLSAPTDPERGEESGGYASEGTLALVRAYIKFEKWDEILRPGGISWPEGEGTAVFKSFAETLAYAAKGKPKEAREKLTEFKAATKAMYGKEKEAEQWFALHEKTAEAMVSLAEGNGLDGQRLLLEAANVEQKNREAHRYANDPPDMPWPVMRLVGDLYLGRGDTKLAIEAYERALKSEPKDGFSLAGLAKAHAAAGDKEKAKRYAGLLAYVWSNADAGLRWTKEVEALKLDAKPLAETPAVERPYRPAELASYGPSNWAPFAAPKLDVLDTNGKRVSLNDYKGKNVLLVFFLNEECVHCVGQLSKINDQGKEFDDANTVILAVSSTPPAKNKASQKLADMHLKLLSDNNHENARRFASYDDFEEMELHSTILIDGQGRIRWKRTGGDAFANVDFLLRELGRVNGVAAKAKAKSPFGDGGK